MSIIVIDMDNRAESNLKETLSNLADRVSTCISKEVLHVCACPYPLPAFFLERKLYYGKRRAKQTDRPNRQWLLT